MSCSPEKQTNKKLSSSCLNWKSCWTLMCVCCFKSYQAVCSFYQHWAQAALHQCSCCQCRSPAAACDSPTSYCLQLRDWGCHNLGPKSSQGQTAGGRGLAGTETSICPPDKKGTVLELPLDGSQLDTSLIHRRTYKLTRWDILYFHCLTEVRAH